MPVMKRTQSMRGQPYNALTVDGLITIHDPMLICKYCKLEECVKHGLYKPIQSNLKIMKIFTM